MDIKSAHSIFTFSHDLLKFNYDSLIFYCIRNKPSCARVVYLDIYHSKCMGTNCCVPNAAGKGFLQLIDTADYLPLSAFHVAIGVMIHVTGGMQECLSAVSR